MLRFGTLSRLGACTPTGGLRGWPVGGDAPALPFHPGDTVSMEKVPVLRSDLPAAIWEQRDHFFIDGMRLEIRPCFREYEPPAFFRDATEKFRGRARLIEDGGLADDTAGLPSPPDAFAPSDPPRPLLLARPRAPGPPGADQRRLTRLPGGSGPLLRPLGPSFADDRWDLRRALVLQARAKEGRGGDPVSRLVLCVDLQTLVPCTRSPTTRRTTNATWDGTSDVGARIARTTPAGPTIPRVRCA
jgi:hypothetical protein